MAPDPQAVAELDSAVLPGPEKIGWRRLVLAGEPVILFYPANDGGQGVPSAWSEPLARRFGKAAAADLAASKGPAKHDASPKPGDYPLLLFAPGAGLGSADYRWLLAGLSSRGMLVAGLNPDASPQASEARVVEGRNALLRMAKGVSALSSYGRIARIDFMGHSIGGASAVAALPGWPGARAVDLDGDFLGISRAPAAGQVLLVSGRNPSEPTRAEARRTADYQLVAGTSGRRLLLPDMRHLGATDAALLPSPRRDGDLGPRPAGTHKQIGEAVAAFLSKGR